LNFYQDFSNKPFQKMLESKPFGKSLIENLPKQRLNLRSKMSDFMLSCGFICVCLTKE